MIGKPKFNLNITGRYYYYILQYISKNQNPVVMEIFKYNPDMVSWMNLSMNPSAIMLLEENISKYESRFWITRIISFIILKILNIVYRLEMDFNLITYNYNFFCILCKYIDYHRDICTLKVNWRYLSKNINAIPLLEKHLDKIDWYYLSRNPNAISLLEKNLDKIDWYCLSRNPNAIHLLEKNLDKIDWKYLSRNPNAIHLLENNLDRIDWKYLSKNPNAIQLLEKNLDKIDWKYLSRNPNAIHLLENNLDKINWIYLSKNPNAIHLLENNLDKVDWYRLAKNPNALHLIIKLDYVFMKKNIQSFNDELLAKVFNPTRLLNICYEYKIELFDLLELY